MLGYGNYVINIQRILGAEPWPELWKYGNCEFRGRMTRYEPSLRPSIFFFFFKSGQAKFKRSFSLKKKKYQLKRLRWPSMQIAWTITPDPRNIKESGNNINVIYNSLIYYIQPPKYWKMWTRQIWTNKQNSMKVREENWKTFKFIPIKY